MNYIVLHHNSINRLTQEYYSTEKSMQTQESKLKETSILTLLNNTRVWSRLHNDFPPKEINCRLEMHHEKNITKEYTFQQNRSNTTIPCTSFKMAQAQSKWHRLMNDSSISATGIIIKMMAPWHRLFNNFFKKKFASSMNLMSQNYYDKLNWIVIDNLNFFC